MTYKHERNRLNRQAVLVAAFKMGARREWAKMDERQLTEHDSYGSFWFSREELQANLKEMKCPIDANQFYKTIKVLQEKKIVETKEEPFKRENKRYEIEQEFSRTLYRFIPNDGYFTKDSLPKMNQWQINRALKNPNLTNDLGIHAIVLANGKLKNKPFVFVEEIDPETPEGKERIHQELGV